MIEAKKVGEPVASPKAAEAGKIEGGAGGTSFVGAGAVDVYRATVLASSLRLWARTGLRPTRGVGITQMLKMAEGYTGCRYKRTQAEAAADAVAKWAQDAAQGMRS